MPNNNSTVFIYHCYRATEPDWYNLVMDGLLPAVLLVFGLGGIFYSRQRLRTDINTKLLTHLLFLYNWDMLFLISVFGFYGFSSLFSSPIGRKTIHGPSIYLYMIFYPLVSLAMTGSMWTLVVISVERFLALSQPLRHHTRDRNRISVIVRMAVVLGSFLISSPRIFELTTIDCLNGDKWEKQISPSKLRIDPYFQLIYRVICNTIFVSPLPFVVVAVVTLKTWLIRRKALHRRGCGGQSASRRRKDKTTALLMAMVAKFLVCQSCPTILNTTELIYVQVRKAAWYNYLIGISNLLVVINCATNWLLFSQAPKTADPVENTGTSSIMTEDQIGAIRNLLPKQSDGQLGAGIIQACAQSNPRLNEQLDEFYCSGSVAAGSRDEKIGQLLQRLFAAALSGQNLPQIQLEISAAARTHGALNVTLRNADWISVKRYLLEQFGEQNDAQVQQLCNRLVSWVLSELKRGFTLPSPSTSHRPSRSHSDVDGSAIELSPLFRQNTPSPCNSRRPTWCQAQEAENKKLKSAG